MKSNNKKVKLLINVPLAAALFLALAGCFTVVAEKPNTTADWNEQIWMKEPGYGHLNWEGQVFHLGNSYMGASCYGSVEKEAFTMGEKTFWTKGPGDSEDYNFGVNPVKDRSLIQKIRDLTSQGKFKEIDAIINQVQISTTEGAGSLSGIGVLGFDMLGHDHDLSGYKRSLDLRKSRVDIEYKIGNTRYTREYFCSYPDRVLAMRFKSHGPDKLNFRMRMDLFHKLNPPKINIQPSSGDYVIDGKIDGNNRPYRVKMKIKNTDGTLSVDKDSLVVKDSSEVVVYYTVATNYKPTPPLYKGADPVVITDSVIASANDSSFDALYERHLKDYQDLYLRTSLELKNDVEPSRVALPTNERLDYYIAQKNYEDLGLKELAFNFGKYILISASRPGTLAAGLQGCWINTPAAQWNGTYQLDMNVTQTYMFGNALNLAECQEPFIDLVKERAQTGKQFAKEYFDCEGWTSFMLTDIWGNVGLLTPPTYKFLSTGWLCHIAWEQYAFEQNPEYLKEIYPVLKGAAEFYLANLVEYKDTKQLVLAGQASAEHQSSIGSTVANFQDLAFVRQTFQNFLEASDILKTDRPFRDKILKAQKQLMPFKIGRWGQLQEWVEDVDDPKCQHRHISHLLALQPLTQINPHTMPELAKAVKVSLEHRGDADFGALNGTTGNNPKDPTTCLHEDLPFDNYTSQVWSRAARLCTWLRLYDGNRADKIYNDILRESTLKNMIQYETKAHYGDSWATPFFLDGITLSAGYVTEMLLQSQHGELELLPALPDAWHTGSIKGIRARGGFTVDIEWKNGKVIHYRIASEKRQSVKVRVNGEVKEIVTVHRL